MTPGVLLWVLAGILIAILTVILAVICTPIRIKALFDTDEKPVANVRVAIFGGLISIPMGRAGTANKKKNSAKNKNKKQKRTSRWTVDWRSGLQAVPRLISRLINQVNIEEVDAKIRFGFPDPADTGLIYGLTVPGTMWASDKDNIEFALQPDFERARLDGDGKFVVRFTPFLIIVPLIGFGWAVFAPKRLRR
jgi:hypothetical protein